MKKNDKKLLKLFTSTFYISAFTFGGGYVILSLMENTFVKKLKWINKEEMLDITAIAQSAPGAVAVNASISLGYKIYGIKGALIASLGTVLPPLIIISIISIFYEKFKNNIYIGLILKGMQAGVGALIMSVVYDMVKDILKGKKIILPLLIMVVSFILNFIFKINLIYIILGVIGLGIIYSYKIERGKKCS